MAKITATVMNMPTVEARQEPTTGDLLATEGGCVYVYTEGEQAICISSPNRSHYIGEEFDGTDIHELIESIGEFSINPKGMVITLTVQ